MTYDARETSAASGKPIELFLFNRDYQAWRYTSADRDIEIEAQTWLARAITRSQIEETEVMRRQNLTLTVQRDLEVADLWRVAPPTMPVTFSLFEFHEGDDEVIVRWTGRVSGVEWEGVSAKITIEPVYTALRRVGLRRMYQRQCPHVLYGPDCRANREAFRVEATADGISGVTLVCSAAAAKPDGYFAGGFIEYEVALGIFERRFIFGQVGETLTLMSAPEGLQAGQAVRLYPGCDHTLATCDEKFANSPNYGGMPYIPQKNPFGGDPIF